MIAVLLGALLWSGIATAEPGPGRLPSDRSLTVAEPFDYTGSSDRPLISARAEGLAAELSRAGPALAAAPIIHRLVSPYLSMTPFDPDANQSLRERLRSRMGDLSSLLEGDRRPIEAEKSQLDDALLRAWACAEGCEARYATVEKRRERLKELEALAVVRIDAAAIEHALILLQLDYLRRVRGLLRVRERRQPEEGAIRGIRPRHALHTELPPELLAEARKRAEERLKSAEAARQHEQRLTNITSACTALEQASKGKTTYLGQVELDQTANEELQGRLTQLNATREQYHARIRELLAAGAVGDDTGEAFDRLHNELQAHQKTAAQSRQQASDGQEAALKDLEEARKALRTARSAVPVVALISDLPDPCSPEGRVGEGALERAQLAAATERVAQEEARVAHRQAQADNAALELELAHTASNGARALKRRVLPHLSADYESSVFKYNPAFFAAAGRNLGHLLRDSYEHLGRRARDLRQAPGRLFSWDGMGAAGSALLWLVVLLFLTRWALKGWARWIIDGWTRVRGHTWLSRVVSRLHSVFKLLSVIAGPLILLVALSVVAYALGGGPEVMAFYFVAQWVLLYRIMRNLSLTLFMGPRWPHVYQADLARALDVSPVLTRESESAALSDRSLHLVIIYFVWRTAVLTTVELLLGQDYLYHLCLDVVSVVQWLLLAVLVLWWREGVAAAWLVYGPQFGHAFVRRFHQRPWFVVFVLPLALIIVARNVVPVVHDTFRGAGFVEFVTGFLSRRALQQAAGPQSGANQSRPEDLPARYRESFALAPLDQEPFGLSRYREVQSIVASYEGWLESKQDGSVAVVGEAGMGKTTLIGQVLDALPIDNAAVLRGRCTSKLATEEAVIQFIASTFGFETVPDSLDALERAILDDPNPVVVIDDAHHFFLKTMGGLAGLDAFLHVVNVTCTNVFWITGFDAYPWYFIKNLKRGEPPFRRIIKLKPLTAVEIEGLILSRDRSSGFQSTFQDLVVQRDVGLRSRVEVVKTVRSYFRVLHDIAGGNPSVALRYWLASLRHVPGTRVLRVGLHNPVIPPAMEDGSDDLLFLLTCIAEHASLTPGQLADVLRMPREPINGMISYCLEHRLLRRRGAAVTLDLDNHREIVRTLTMRGFVYF